MDKMKFSELLTSYLDLRDSTKDEDDWTPIDRSSSRREQMNDLLQEMDTMDSVSAMLAATPVPAPAQERCSTCGYLTSEREHLGCLRMAVKDLDIATGGPYDEQEVGLTDEQTLKDAYQEGYYARVTYNDAEESDLETEWSKSSTKALISALRAKGNKL